jgi:CRISPR/Cas system-associated endonuclease Cas3-HD
MDNPLQNKYREIINNLWTKKLADEILIDFYKNLQIESNRKNLNHIFNEISKNNLKNLSRIRIFDILWWSYLKAKDLNLKEKINWSTIKFTEKI